MKEIVYFNPATKDYLIVEGSGELQGDPEGPREVVILKSIRWKNVLFENMKRMVRNRVMIVLTYQTGRNTPGFIYGDIRSGVLLNTLNLGLFL